MANATMQSASGHTAAVASSKCFSNHACLGKRPDSFAGSGANIALPPPTHLAVDAAADQTSYRPDQASWSLDNLPDCLYVFRPPQGWANVTGEPPKMPYPIHGRILRAFPGLPDNVSTKVSGWRMTAWMRLDARMTRDDIWDRMEPTKLQTDFRSPRTTLSCRQSRFCEHYHVCLWTRKTNHESSAREAQIASLLQAQGIVGNTTRGLTPGLIVPALGEAGGRVSLRAGSRRRVGNDPVAPANNTAHGTSAFLTIPQPSTPQPTPQAPTSGNMVLIQARPVDTTIQASGTAGEAELQTSHRPVSLSQARLHLTAGEQGPILKYLSVESIGTSDRLEATLKVWPDIPPSIAAYLAARPYTKTEKECLRLRDATMQDASDQADEETEDVQDGADGETN